MGYSWRLSADEFLLLRETVDERYCRDEVGVSTFAKAVAAYRPDPRFPGCVARGLLSCVPQLKVSVTTPVTKLSKLNYSDAN